jgi:ADP-heptose:LPS heptosyltransferase
MTKIESVPTNTILVIRFSALGDVAMTVPVVKDFLEAHPEKKILMLSNQAFAGLFEDIERLEFIGADFNKEHKGLLGIYKLLKLLKSQYAFDDVADLHSVLRTIIIRTWLKLNKKKVAFIDKGRFEKLALTRKEQKIYRPLPHTTERYGRVFDALVKRGNGVTVNQINGLDSSTSSTSSTPSTNFHIGIAPFAKHEPKMYNLDKMKEVVRLLGEAGHRITLFGGGGAEKRIIDDWVRKFSHVSAVPDGIGLKGEIELMRGLNLMLSMDSANMHLASLAGIRVVSIWGATHPYAGFYGYNQNPLDAVQVSLPCRPCSVFGNKPCWRGDHACMQGVSVEQILEKIMLAPHS